MRILDRLLRAVLVLMVSMACFMGTLAVISLVADCDAYGEHGGELAVRTAITTLQPRHTPEVAAAYAGLFLRAADEHELDPLLLVAIAFRESSLISGVRGALGERGLLQVHGAALLGRPSECSAELLTTSCELRTGAAWLAHSRDVCPGTMWRWVTAYGHGRCLSEAASRQTRGTAVARRYYVQVGGTGWGE